MAALRSELLMALWEKEDAARQQPAAAAVRGNGGVPRTESPCCCDYCALSLPVPPDLWLDYPCGRAPALASVSHTSAASYMQQCLLSHALPGSCNCAHSARVPALLRAVRAVHCGYSVAQPCRLLACVLPHRRLR